MEEKQLDFSQPILSVRRASSPVVVKEMKNRKPAAANVARFPHQKAESELNLGQVRVSGTVPFMWERSPGRPKNEAAISEPSSPAVPRLPPGRRKPLILNVKHIASEYGAGGSEGSSSPAPSCSPQTKNGFFANSPTVQNAEAKFNDDDDDDEEEEEEVSFVDAHDTLSRTGSSFLNCSDNGLDGSDMRLNRTLSGDFRAREFMIGRFLPAAEALASETSQYSPRYHTKRQPVLKEQARQIKMMERSEKKPPSNRGDILAYKEDTEDNTDEDHSEPDNASLRLCGLLSRSYLMNPGIGKQDHVPASSVRIRGVQSSQPSGYRSKHTIDNGGGSSPNKGWSHNESAQPFAPKEQGFLGIPERYRNLETVGSILCVKEDISSFCDLLADDDIEWESGSSTPVLEKTLYIDHVHDASSQDLKNSKPRGEKGEEELKKFQSFGSCYLSFSDDEAQVGATDDDSQTPVQDLSNLIKRKPVDNRRKDDFQNQQKHSAIYPLSPPLPKSPSESWLKKALPNVSSRTQLLKSPLGVLVFPKSSPEVVWKTIVKASDGKNMRFQFSEGKLKPIQEA
ncbi:hypothetical protein LINPERHAP2_LOCUS1781 [Linum perenne]